MVVLNLHDVSRAWTGGDEVFGIWNGGSKIWPVSASPLSQYYGVGPGQISLHLEAGVDGSVTHLTNRGGAGAHFDAAVSGPAINVSAHYLSCVVGGGLPILQNAANLTGVRLMWVMNPESSTETYRIFGFEGAAGETGYVRRNVNGESAAFQLYYDGASGRLPAYGAGTARARLYEIEFSDTQITEFIDGVPSGDATHGFQDRFQVDRLGQGSSSFQQFVGQMGDVLGVVVGPGADQAIDAARAYLNARFDLGLTL